MQILLTMSVMMKVTERIILPLRSRGSLGISLFSDPTVENDCSFFFCFESMRLSHCPEYNFKKGSQASVWKCIHVSDPLCHVIFDYDKLKSGIMFRGSISIIKPETTISAPFQLIPADYTSVLMKMNTNNNNE